jgi:hypothetical protein
VKQQYHGFLPKMRPQKNMFYSLILMHINNYRRNAEILKQRRTGFSASSGILGKNCTR